MKILVTGASGMLGSEIVKQLKDKSYDVQGTDSDTLDITKLEEVKSFFESNKPDVVINCAAYTNVNECEENFELCKLVNTSGAGNLAKVSKEYNSLIIQLSSDYVFGEDKKDGYNEDHLPLSPVNKYGSSKALGEKEIVDNTDNYYIIRTQWLYGNGAKNFIAKILELADKLPELKVVTDEIGIPTYVKDLTEKITWMIENKVEAGTYHITNSGKPATRKEFAEEILKLAGKNTKVLPTTHAQYGRGTKVPVISILNNTKLPKLRDWKEALSDFIKNNNE